MSAATAAVSSGIAGTTRLRVIDRIGAANGSRAAIASVGAPTTSVDVDTAATGGGGDASEEDSSCAADPLRVAGTVRERPPKNHASRRSS